MTTAIAKLSPWLARPLSEATKSAKLRETLNQHAEQEIRDKLMLKAAWIIFGAGVISLLASIFLVVCLFPLKTKEVDFYTVDHTTGSSSPAVTVTDAPQLFGEAEDHESLESYLNACEGWVPEADRDNWHQCMLMSRADQQERYAAWRKLPTSPLAALGEHGHAELHNYRFWPICGTASTSPCGAKDDKTHRYIIKYDFAASKAGSTTSKPWTAHVDFQWHPELKMSKPDRDRNAKGFQGFSENAEPDNGK